MIKKIIEWFKQWRKVNQMKTQINEGLIELGLKPYFKRSDVKWYRQVWGSVYGDKRIVKETIYQAGGDNGIKPRLCYEAWHQTKRNAKRKRKISSQSFFEIADFNRSIV